MADRPRSDDWWLASDGRWYPPELDPGEDAARLPDHRDDGSAISSTFTRVVSIALSVASVILAGTAYAGLRYASALQKYIGELSDAEAEAVASTELNWVSWTAVGLLALILTGGLVIGWTYGASRALDKRGPIGRRWRGGWTIGSWLIPFGNLILPKLVFNEIERIVQVPYEDVPIDEQWRNYTRSQLGDLWWLLWIGGVIPSQLIQITVGDPAGDAGRMAVVVTISSFTFALFAGAGIALALLIRRIERSSHTTSSAARDR